MIYMLELAFLFWAYGGQDSTAMDWAVVVLLLGGLVVSPMATALATLPALLVRASFVFAYSADPTTKSSFDSYGRWLLNSRFWTEEQWVWIDPGVLLLMFSVLTAIIVQVFWKKCLKRGFPIWIGIPIALITQSTYVLAIDSQWGSSSAQQYLQDEAGPASISLALVITALMVLLTSLQAARDKRRMQMAELESARNELKFLNAQIKPHFLNNSLNTIAAVATNQPERTSELINKLALHYRAQCDVASSLVRFEDEWKLVQCYIDIEKIRMGERLKVYQDIHPACMNVTLPRLIIQPLVENAIQHGILDLKENGVVKIMVQLSKGRFIVTVEDNGVGQMKIPSIDEFGTGLSNVQSRLKHFYDVDASLNIESEWGAGTTVTLNIPSNSTVLL